MKIAIVTNFLYPEALGGTELYCYQLAAALLSMGHEVYWIVPNFNNDTTITSTYENGLKIIRFAAIDKGMKPDAAFVSRSFVKEMNERNITVAHFNEFGGFEGISGDLLREAKQSGIRTIVTLHVADYICRTGTLRYGSKLSCDGKVIPSRCGACNIFSDFSGSRNLNYTLTASFKKIFDLIYKTNFYVLPQVKRTMNNFKAKLPFIQSLRENADTIVSITKWFREILIANEIPAGKIKYIPQAIPDMPFIPRDEQKKRNGYVFIGRINKEKGIELLIQAAKLLHEKVPGTFIDIFGPVAPENKYANDFIKEVEQYENIHYKKVLAPEEVMPVIAQYKAVLLPSLVSEMAPLIIPEANKLKVPVIASDVPGSVELINQYHSGLIFKYASADDLVEKIMAIEKDTLHFKFDEVLKNDFNTIALQYLEIYNKAFSIN